MPNASSGFVFDGYARNYDWVYDYLDNVLHQKLWVSEEYRPYMAVGSVRMVQYRVKNKCEKDNSTLSESCTDL
jgi:hypothetical protein